MFRIMMRIVSVLSVCFLIPVETTPLVALQTSDIPTVSYCELISKAESYDRKTVRVTGTYESGFEWSDLNCSNCWSRVDSTWVEFSIGQCPKSKKVKNNHTFDVTFVGMFETGRDYGHLNGYRYRLQVFCVESVKKAKKSVEQKDCK